MYVCMYKKWDNENEFKILLMFIHFTLIFCIHSLNH